MLPMATMRRNVAGLEGRVIARYVRVLRELILGKPKSLACLTQPLADQGIAAPAHCQPDRTMHYCHSGSCRAWQHRR